jgi:hypothetical protein
MRSVSEGLLNLDVRLIIVMRGFGLHGVVIFWCLI